MNLVQTFLCIVYYVSFTEFSNVETNARLLFVLFIGICFNEILLYFLNFIGQHLWPDNSEFRFLDGAAEANEEEYEAQQNFVL